MFIEPIKCKKCGLSGYAAEEPFQMSNSSDGSQLHCKCGNTIELKDQEAIDQQILSKNTFSRLTSVSNYSESGTLTLKPGESVNVQFSRHIDYICKVFLTPNAQVLTKEAFVSSKSMIVLTSIPPIHGNTPPIVDITWMVYGLINVDLLPAWHIHFYSAITQNENRLYKAAVIDYAVAFETFLESFLVEKFTSQFGNDLSKYILKRINKIEDRTKELLQYAIGYRLTERADVYQPWDDHVRRPRNRLAHGERLFIGKDEAEAAHSACYQAIRWIQSQNDIPRR
ncbi:MAG: hypothetical protein MUO31_14940 [Thermodesulfovibrionales bacterium]|nr:hypothetical protein [Thermodesulfovibrionales bacterium]